MNAQRKRIIISEIQYWKKNRLLPEHYCDFLITLYAQGETDETEIEKVDKGILEKETILSSKMTENIENNERLAMALNNIALNINSILVNFDKQKDSYMHVSENLNANIVSLNSHMHNLSSENLKAIYANIIKSIETMKGDMEKIEWRFTQGLEKYDEKIKNSLELIDEEASKIIKDLSEFKELQK